MGAKARSLPVIFAVWMALGGLAASLDSAAAQARELKDLARQAKPSVVLLRVLDGLGNEIGTGTGFFVASDGWIVTNFHVIEDAAAVEAQLDGLERLTVSGVLAKDEVNDLAVVQVDGQGFPALPLADPSQQVEVGERVVVLGGPLGLASTLSEGTVSAVRQPGDPALQELGATTTSTVLQITASISPGSSGSPVIDPQGKTIGVVVSQVPIGQNLNFAVPVTAVHDLLAGIDPSAPPVALAKGASRGGGGFLRNAVISAVFFALTFLGYRRLAR